MLAGVNKLGRAKEKNRLSQTHNAMQKPDPFLHVK